jgi:excisionase family DNA binding protein
MSKQAAKPRLLTRREAAEYLGLKPRTLADWAMSGRYGLPFVKVGRRVMYRPEDIDRFLASRTITRASQIKEAATV